MSIVVRHLDYLRQGKRPIACSLLSLHGDPWRAPRTPADDADSAMEFTIWMSNIRTADTSKHAL